jgi:hypothetical protein
MRPTFIIAAAAGFAALPILFGPAWAGPGANRTFVSGSGSDANPCSLSAPCRSFAQALTQTSAGGDIVVLDSAGYGQVTITKSVSILNEEGVEAGITVTSGDGITITAAATDVVNLRGLTVVGAGGNNGITFTSGTVLNIQNCVIRGFTGVGLALFPAASANINVSNTIVSGNSGAGVALQPSGAGTTVTASFEQVQAIHNSDNGFSVFGFSMTSGTLSAIAADSLASGNGGTGFSASSLSGRVRPTFTVANSKAANNGIGVDSAANSVMFLNGSTVSGNFTDGFLVETGGTIFSYSNNAITDTTNGGSLTSTLLR